MPDARGLAIRSSPWWLSLLTWPLQQYAWRWNHHLLVIELRWPNYAVYGTAHDDNCLFLLARHEWIQAVGQLILCPHTRYFLAFLCLTAITKTALAASWNYICLLALKCHRFIRVHWRRGVSVCSSWDANGRVMTVVVATLIGTTVTIAARLWICLLSKFWFRLSPTAKYYRYHRWTPAAL